MWGDIFCSPSKPCALSPQGIPWAKRVRKERADMWTYCHWKRSESTLLWNGTNSIIFKHRGQRPQSRRAWEAPLSIPIGRSFPEVLTEESALCKTCRTSSCCSRSSLKRRRVLRQPRLILPVSYLHSAPLKRSPPATTRQNRLPGLGFMYNALPLHNIYLVLFLVCAQRGKMRLLISE